jgi:hypothetical protein
MLYATTVGVDLAKNVIQISVVSGRGRELSNRSLTRKKFAEFLGKQQAVLVAFEACAFLPPTVCRKPGQKNWVLSEPRQCT